MLTSYSSKIRKIADLIERDNTPSNATIGDQSIPINQKRVKDRRIEDQELSDNNPIRKKTVEEEVIKPTAMPEQRRPRKQLEYEKKWNEDSSADNMQQYMKDYRLNKKDKEAPGLKSTYHKKL